MTKEIIDNDPYKSAGVDINAGNELVDLIKKDVSASHGPNVLGNIGGFAGMFRLDKEYKNPILVACTDGVGTKVALAQETGMLEGIGQDLVAMCVNDWLISGDMNTAFESSNFVEDFEDKLRTFLSRLIDESLDEFQIQISNESFAYISIQGINNLEDYFELNKKMKMILSIPSLEIISFSDNTISYKASTYGSIDSILKEIESNGFLDILASEEGSNSINLYYKK